MCKEGPWNAMRISTTNGRLHRKSGPLSSFGKTHQSTRSSCTSRKVTPGSIVFVMPICRCWRLLLYNNGLPNRARGQQGRTIKTVLRGRSNPTKEPLRSRNQQSIDGPKQLTCQAAEPGRKSQCVRLGSVGPVCLFFPQFLFEALKPGRVEVRDCERVILMFRGWPWTATGSRWLSSLPLWMVVLQSSGLNNALYLMFGFSQPALTVCVRRIKEEVVDRIKAGLGRSRTVLLWVKLTVGTWRWSRQLLPQNLIVFHGLNGRSVLGNSDLLGEERPDTTGSIGQSLLGPCTVHRQQQHSQVF